MKYPTKTEKSTSQTNLKALNIVRAEVVQDMFLKLFPQRCMGKGHKNDMSHLNLRNKSAGISSAKLSLKWCPPTQTIISTARII